MPEDRQVFALDDKGNVKVEDLRNGKRVSVYASTLIPLRDVDWRSSQPEVTQLGLRRQAVAAHAQRCGDILAIGESCRSCQHKNGPFESCVVLYMFVGPWWLRQSSLGRCCMNCHFSSHAPNCSLVNENQGTGARKSQTQADGGAVDSTGAVLEYLRAKKRKRNVEYDSTYYQSPLDQFDIKGEGKYSEKRHALESIHTVYERVVQDIDRLFRTLSKANELDSGEDTEGEQEDPVVVEPDMAAEDAQKVPGETPVKEKEREKKDVKIAESAVKKEEEEEEEKPTISRKPRAARGKGKNVLAIEEK
ncbi:hypothetical protein N7489_008262 [Penicillium chrysogenum]|uniref:Uncharacterized protein n=1 Tax=Penicillium chrysogenum TaxID=5076 RepID=A0ABQ8W9P5_PENCH|nr:uncharacterized protein N7489_008262 [Penicillium chrysogenum]KAJ5238171.1 hypothetical protein N7489_008262 [Penicillium chrysogenum]KAJ5261561.1 hypothetical protein N7505_008428 [Penicillium chrysogenum]